ncbi:hypothetical protein ELI49_37370 [Rhizobium ruizarguesonis]|uniref:DUF4276 family protein n=1 Tax=Rhizobium ruizarguesonis TaxID=2081791 RepID=A0AAE8Q3Q5_9HYPH|nr:hypothetical protein [Rhizobium ruizarguesonis]NEH87453.1 hypothetical protein [Rhizobium ruizarguesonis]NEI16429.1 hypothetical protein [Rhizobium ruizarguesonis]NEJ08652.1 hypothetical protein [Rhizobium ruizarguesonis]NEJ17060.1 hypothetical protein [Rhizobium ruizarguesonis]NEJ59488.1 hypothetical protein [Rhizobium ruizarguesonis]
MDSDVFDVHCIRRQVGSTGLVIFERDDILLRHKPQLEDQTLGDIDADFVAMLQDMRDLDVRFGFISHHSAPPFDTRVRIDSATLTRLLDDLLKVSGALPDFWIDAACTSDLRQRQRSHSRSEVDLITKLTGWYEADLNRTVLVRKAEAPRVSPDTPGLKEIFYPGLSARAPSNTSRRATVGWLKMMIKHALDLE